MKTPQNDIMVEVNNLRMHFPIRRGILRRKVGQVKAVDDIDFTIRRHETLGLVGESRCGKTATGRCISRLYNPTSGSIFLDGTDISRIPEKQLKPIRRSIGTILQDSSVWLKKLYVHYFCLIHLQACTYTNYLEIMHYYCRYSHFSPFVLYLSYYSMVVVLTQE